MNVRIKSQFMICRGSSTNIRFFVDFRNIMSSGNIRLTASNAQSLGIRISTKRTFLSFEKENSSLNRTDEGDSDTHSRRRFTTTDLILNKDILNQLSEINGELVSTSEETGALTSRCTSKMVDSDSSPCIFVKNLPSVIQPQTPGTQDCAFTTVMVRNIPNRYDQDSLISFIQSMGFAFNFFYCPIDRLSRANCGYFFVNLLDHDTALEFMRRFEGLQLPAFRSRKVCSPCWARIQGYSSNVDYYLNSTLMQLSHELRPRVFDLSGCEYQGAPKLESVNSRKVFVGGLSPGTTAETIGIHMSQFGEVEDVSIILDSNSRTSRGFCFVTFRSIDEAIKCVENKQLHFIDGRSLGIRPYSRH
jgi:RNA recognition motif-containing protein